MRRLITGPGRVSALVGEAERRREHAVRVEVPAWADEWLSRARSTGLPVRALICTNIPLLGYARGAYCFQSGEVWLWADEEWAMRQVLLHEFGHAARRSLSMDTGDRDLLAGWARDERETWQAAYVLAQDWGLGGWMTEADLDSRLAEVATAHRRYEMVGARLGCGWRGPVERALDLAESWDPPRHLFAPESLRRPTPGARMRDGDRLSALGGEGALARALHVAREMCGMARVPLALHGRIELRGEDDLAMAIGGLSDLL
ncbi:MAG TPA: hypothetical protein VNL71_24495, partial [Chloroflexota bacterium]|nr:hypothetical protein [Chloroflexota bacterium]